MPRNEGNAVALSGQYRPDPASNIVSFLMADKQRPKEQQTRIMSKKKEKEAKGPNVTGNASLRKA